MQAITGAPSWHTLVHIGAGHGAALPAYRDAGLERLVLIEPLPQLAQGLEQAVNDQPNAEVWELAVAAQSGRGELVEYNWADASSLLAPTGLNELFPGLKPVAKHEVQCISPDELMERLELPGDGQHWLVVEANGEEGAILQALMQGERLARFARLEITLPPEPLYAGSLSAEVLLQALQEYGYALAACDESDPDMPRWQLVLEPYRRELRQAQRELEAERQTLAKQKTQQQQLDKQLKAAQDKLATTQQAKAEVEKAHTASQQATERAQQEIQELNARQAELQQQLTKHQERLAQQDKTLAEQKNQLAQKNASLAEQQDQLAQKDKSLTEQKTQQQRLDKQLKAAQDELATAQQARAEAEKAHAESQQAAEQDVQQLKAKLAEQQEKLEQTHTWFMNRKQQAEEGAEQIKALQGEHQASQARLTQAEAALREKDATIARLDEQLAAQRQGNDETQSRFAALESKLEGLFGEQRSYIQQTTSALGQHVTRTSRQQRDEQALTHYLQHGQRPVSTELSPGFAMALLEHRETQRYAVMVVLGSTPVTELLAQAVNNESLQQPQLTATHPTEQGKELQHYITPSQDDLPQAVISMAHKKSIGKALKQRLAASHNQAAVNVVHAPWVEANAQGELFYAWEATLKRLNQWLEEDAKVLVVIGNALAEANHSRISALPPLLQHLPTQTLDVVVEGNHYPHESGLKAEWEAVLGKRERDVEELHLPTALGLRITG